MKTLLLPLCRVALAVASLAALRTDAAEHPLVLQTDFGLKDGAVAAMRGVAAGVSSIPLVNTRSPLHRLIEPNFNFFLKPLQLLLSISVAARALS